MGDRRRGRRSIAALLLLPLLPLLVGAWDGEEDDEEIGQQRTEEGGGRIDRELQDDAGPPECRDVVPGWMDPMGFSCIWYSTYGRCSRDGSQGPKWNPLYGNLAVWMKNGYSALTACCGCGACPNCRGCDHPLPLHSPRDFREFATFNCSHVIGDLVIRPQSDADLDCLAGLESISGALTISYGNVTSMRGLSSLKRISRNFRVVEISSIPSFKELRNLTVIGKRLYISENSHLTSLEGLENVRSVGGTLYIEENPLLSSIDGLRGLRSIGMDISVSIMLYDLPVLGTIRGLAGVRGRLWGGLSLTHLPVLETLDGLEGITGVGVGSSGLSVELSDLAALRSISGLRGLRGALRGGVGISNAMSLQSIAGLEGLTSFKALHLSQIAVETLDGLGSLTSLSGGQLSLQSLVQLRSIKALQPNLTGSLGSGLILRDLPLLQSLEGLEGITSIGQSSGVSLEVEKCSLLTDLSALSSLRGPIPGSMTVESCYGLRSLQGLEGVTSVGGPLEIYNCENLESLAALGGLRGPMNSRIRLASLPLLKSMHGLEGLNSSGHSQACSCGGGCTDLLGSSITVDDCEQLQSVSALGSVHGGIGVISISTAGALRSLQGIWGILARRLVVEVAEKKPQLCITEAERQRLEALPASACGDAADAASIVGYQREEQVASASSCVPCDPPCGNLANGHPIECDYRRGECRCPLGTGGPGCRQALPRVSVVPKQIFECSLSTARHSKSQAVCDLRVLVRKAGLPNSSDPSSFALHGFDPKRVFTKTQAWFSSLSMGNVTWHNATHGEILAHLMLIGMTRLIVGRSVVRGSVGYELDAAPDGVLDGTVLEGPLTSPSPRIYPWCLSLGAGCRLTSPESFEVGFTMNGGKLRFMDVRGQFSENHGVAVVILQRVGGVEGMVRVRIGVDEAASTAKLGVDFFLSTPWVLWDNGDAEDKAALVKLLNNDVWEQSKTIVLYIKEVRVPLEIEDSCRDSVNQRHNITLLDDGDGGQLRFLPPKSVREDAGEVGECLVEVERIQGNSGSTSVRVLLEPFAQQCGAPPDLVATPDSPSVAPGEADFRFVEGLPLTWADGESGAKCVFRGPEAAGLTIYADWSREGNEVFCLVLAEVDGAASLNPSEVHTLVTIQDGGAQKSEYMECDRGVCRCAPGWYANETARSDECQKCEPGHFCTGGSHRALCQPGSFIASTGQSACDHCREGAYQDNPGAAFCVDCPLGSFANASGSSACSHCDDLWGMPGFTTVRPFATSPSDCACPPGSYLPCEGRLCLAGEAPPAGGCVPCPKGFACPGGLEPLDLALSQQQGGRALSQIRDPSATKVHVGPLLQPGNFAPLSEPYCAIKCGVDDPQKICPGQRRPGVCGDAHRLNALACGACESGFHSSGDGCTPCGDRPLDVVYIVVAGPLGLVGAVVLAYMVNTEQARQHHAFLALAATFSLALFALQALSVFGQFSLPWIDPAATILKVMTSMFNFRDLPLLRLDCQLQGKTDLATYLLRLGLLPLAMAFAFVGVLAKNFRRTLADVRAETIQTLGTVSLVFFIVIITGTLQPFVVFRHHCQDKFSLVAYPNVFVGTEEYWPLLASGVVAALLLPLPFLAFCCWAIWKVPSRVGQGDTNFLRSYRFLFGKFRHEAYYYSLVVLARNTSVSLVPVVARDSATAQILLSLFVIALPMVAQTKLEPWRIYQLNNLETGCLFVLIHIICFGALLADMPEDIAGLEYVCLIMFVLLLLMVVVYMTWCIVWAFRPLSLFAFFICHSKGDAGTRARALQLRIMQDSRWSNPTFIDADHLFNLDTLFETVRSNVRNLVVLLTKSTLHRPWCAGEITTATQNKIPIVVVRCADFVPPQDLEEELPGMLDYAASGLVQYGINPEDIQLAYQSLLDMSFIEAAKRLGNTEFEMLTSEIFDRSNSFFRRDVLRASLVKAKSLAKPTGKVAVLTEATDAEGVAGAVILFQELLPNLEESCFLQVQSGAFPMPCQDIYDYIDLPRRLEHACHSAVILLSRGSLGSPENLELIVRVMERFDAGDLNVVSVTLPGFEFPGNEYYDVQLPRLLEGEGSDEDIVEGYVAVLKHFFKLISVSFNTHGSKSVIKAQATEVLRRVKLGATGQFVQSMMSTKSSNDKKATQLVAILRSSSRKSNKSDEVRAGQSLSLAASTSIKRSAVSSTASANVEYGKEQGPSGRRTVQFDMAETSISPLGHEASAVDLVSASLDVRSEII